jgi:hypothetical protein
MLVKGLLERIERTISRGDRFDRRHLCAIELRSEHRAALRWFSIDVDRACTATAGIAPDVSAGQTKSLPEEMHRQLVCGHSLPPRLTVHDNIDDVH